MFFLKIDVDFDSKEKAKHFFEAIEPELDEEFVRSTTKISQSGKKLGIEINASDKSAMRASLNSVMKPLILFEQLEAL